MCDRYSQSYSVGGNFAFHSNYLKAVHSNDTQTHPFNGPLSRTTRVGQYHKGKTSLHFTEARDSEWQWHQLGHMQVCTSLQTDNHASTPLLSFLQAGCPSCRPTNSIKALKAISGLYLRHNSIYVTVPSLCNRRMFINLPQYTLHCSQQLRFSISTRIQLVNRLCLY